MRRARHGGLGPLTYPAPKGAARGQSTPALRAFLGLLYLLGPPVGAQSNTTERAQELITQAQALLTAGDTSAALERLEAAREAAPSWAETHYRYGQLLVRLADNGLDDTFERRKAASALNRALDLDPDNPAILLEHGRLRLKDSFLRIAAQRSFNRALDAAKKRNEPALVAEVSAEIGDIYYRRYQAQADRRMIVGGALRFDPSEALYDPHYTKHFLETQTAVVPEAGELDLRTAEAHYREGFTADPSNEAAATGFLGLLYDRGRYEEFLEGARTFARAAPANGRARLLLGLGLWRVGRNREAGRAFDRALALMPPADLATLTNLSVILRRSDALNYQSLSDTRRSEYERRYWFMADPLRLTEENEHRLEHFSRVAYADLRYSAPDLHLRGWETDRGVISVRYGPPPVIATFPPDTRATGGGPFNVIPEPEGLEGPAGSATRAMSDPTMAGKVVTVWLYPERNLRFVFYGPPSYNFAKLAGDFQAYADDARYTIPVKYDNVPVNEALDSVPVQTAGFRSTAGETEVMFYAGIPVSRLVAGTDVDRGQLETGFFVTEPQLTDVVARRETEVVDFHAHRQFESRTFQAILTPGEYLYRIEARQPVTGRASRGSAVLGVDDLSRRTLMLSDVVLADRVEPRSDTLAGRRDFFMLPNPGMTFAPGQPIHLYWEVYGITADSAGVARYDVEIAIRIQSLERRTTAARVVGGVLDAVGVTAEGDERLALAYTREHDVAGRDRLPEYVAVELDDAPNGVYTLEVLVTDRGNGQSFMRRRSFRVSDTPEAP